MSRFATTANQKIPLAQHILKRLHQHGCSHLHGVPGDYSLPFLSHLSKSKVKWIGNCNELNAGYAADSYARITGLGALCTTFGVGELSALNAFAGSYAERVPVVHIVGMPHTDVEHRRAALMPGFIQTFDPRTLVHHQAGRCNSTRVYRNMVKKILRSGNILVLADSKEEDMAAAFDRVLASALFHQEPAYVGLSSNHSGILVESPNHTIPLTRSELGAKESPEQSSQLARDIASLIGKSKRPLIFVDGLSRQFGHTEAINSLVAASMIPTVCTPHGLGIVSSDHENYYGVYTAQLGSSDLQEYVKNSDCVLIFGELFSDTNTVGWNAIPPTDPDRTIWFGNNHVRVHGDHSSLDCRNLVDKLTANLTAEKESLTLTASKTRNEKYLTVPPALILPQPVHAVSDTEPAAELTQDYIYPRLSSWLRSHDTLLLANGTPLIGAALLSLPPNVRVFASGLWFSVGQMLPATQGAALAQTTLPEDKRGRTILLEGDGGFQATSQELSTIIRYKLDATIFLFNNKGYAYERLIDGPEASYNDVNNWNYLLAPRLMGASEQSTDVQTKQGVDGEPRKPYFVYTRKVTNTRELDEVLTDRYFNTRHGLKFIELQMGEKDVPSYFKPALAAAAERLTAEPDASFTISKPAMPAAEPILPTTETATSTTAPTSRGAEQSSSTITEPATSTSIEPAISPVSQYIEGSSSTITQHTVAEDHVAFNHDEIDQVPVGFATSVDEKTTHVVPQKSADGPEPDVKADSVTESAPTGPQDVDNAETVRQRLLKSLAKRLNTDREGMQHARAQRTRKPAVTKSARTRAKERLKTLLKKSSLWPSIGEKASGPLLHKRFTVYLWYCVEQIQYMALLGSNTDRKRFEQIYEWAQFHPAEAATLTEDYVLHEYEHKGMGTETRDTEENVEELGDDLEELAKGVEDLGKKAEKVLGQVELMRREIDSVRKEMAVVKEQAENPKAEPEDRAHGETSVPANAWKQREPTSFGDEEAASAELEGREEPEIDQEEEQEEAEEVEDEHEPEGAASRPPGGEIVTGKPPDQHFARAEKDTILAASERSAVARMKRELNKVEHKIAYLKELIIRKPQGKARLVPRLNKALDKQQYLQQVYKAFNRPQAFEIPTPAAATAPGSTATGHRVSWVASGSSPVEKASIRHERRKASRVPDPKVVPEEHDGKLDLSTRVPEVEKPLNPFPWRVGAYHMAQENIGAVDATQIPSSTKDEYSEEEPQQQHPNSTVEDSDTIGNQSSRFAMTGTLEQQVERNPEAKSQRSAHHASQGTDPVARPWEITEGSVVRTLHSEASAASTSLGSVAKPAVKDNGVRRRPLTFRKITATEKVHLETRFLQKEKERFMEEKAENGPVLAQKREIKAKGADDGVSKKDTGEFDGSQGWKTL